MNSKAFAAAATLPCGHD